MTYVYWTVVSLMNEIITEIPFLASAIELSDRVNVAFLFINRQVKADHQRSAEKPSVVFPAGRRHDPIGGPSAKGSGHAKELPCKRSGLCSLGEVQGHIGDISTSELLRCMRLITTVSADV